MNTLECTGTFIPDLTELVERVEASGVWNGAMERVLIAAREAPDMWLSRVLTRIADPVRGRSRYGVRDSGDSAAWYRVQDVQQCLVSGLTRVCVHCRRMEGEHTRFDWCPTDLWFTSTTRFTPEESHAVTAQ